MYWSWLCIAALCLGWCSLVVTGIPASCDSKIFCQGDLLKTVQLNDVFKDSKTFVDRKMKYSESQILQNFADFIAKEGQDVSREKLVEFVDQNFEENYGIEAVQPTDWVESPPVLDKIADPELKQWASELNAIWKNLTRRVTDDVKQNGDKYSILYIPKNFVIAGGRFKEIYYWDTYWIMQGLLQCNMTTTARDIIENFVYMIENYGIVPNGGRVYYLQRSEPPLLIPMVANYYNATRDLDLLKNIIGSLEKEFQFWMDNRTVQVDKAGKSYTLARYYAVSTGPRPESYGEDYELAHENFDTEERRQEFYVDLKSGAEAGLDFSSKWFIANNGTDNGDLSSIHTKYIVPVELNAYLCWNAKLLSGFHSELGNSERSADYEKIAASWQDAVTAVLWNEDQGSWFDYDLLNEKQREYFYPTNIAPLLAGCYDQSKVATIAQQVVSYIQKNNITSYRGGVPASVQRTGEQWDLPNAWPPLQSIFIRSLAETRQPSAMDLAYHFAEQWILSNHQGYQKSKEMYEKYDAEHPGKYGGGGEYTVQTGFGWTNGVVLELLATYGDKLSASNTIKNRH